ncbi:MAG: iron-containing alcohol dehydrogenase [Pseudomonadota bacterium]
MHFSVGKIAVFLKAGEPEDLRLRDTAMSQTFDIAPTPPVIAGRGAAKRIQDVAATLAIAKPLLVIDSFLVGTGYAMDVQQALAKQGIQAHIFAGFSGEPKAAHINAGTQTALAHACDGVIGIGGGTTLDIAKLVACCAACGSASPDIGHYALGVAPLPDKPLPKLLVPTTAGTGSEMSATNIFAGEDGRKLWAWAPQSRADMAIIDGDLLTSMPPALLVWCAMDAFVHAFEASTNTSSNEGASLYGHRAMALIARQLPAALTGDGDALQALAMASAWAGVAIDRCGTAIAHMASHGLAGIAPVHHGMATALAFEATLPWLLECDAPSLHEAARACGTNVDGLPALVSSLIDLASTSRQWPEQIAAIEPQHLAAEMARPENAPMRNRTVRPVTDADMLLLARRILMSGVF